MSGKSQTLMQTTGHSRLLKVVVRVLLCSSYTTSSPLTMPPHIPTGENSDVRRSNRTGGQSTQAPPSENGAAGVPVSSFAPTLLGSQGSHINGNTLVTRHPSLRAVRRESRPPVSESEVSYIRNPMIEALDIVTSPSRTDDLGGRRRSVVVFVNAADNRNGRWVTQAETHHSDETPADTNGPQSSRSSMQAPSPSTSISRNSTSSEEDWHAERLADKRRELAKRHKSGARRRVRPGSGSGSATSGAEELETEECDDKTEPCDDEE